MEVVKQVLRLSKRTRLSAPQPPPLTWLRGFISQDDVDPTLLPSFRKGFSEDDVDPTHLLPSRCSSICIGLLKHRPAFRYRCPVSFPVCSKGPSTSSSREPRVDTHLTLKAAAAFRGFSSMPQVPTTDLRPLLQAAGAFGGFSSVPQVPTTDLPQRLPPLLQLSRDLEDYGPFVGIVDFFACHDPFPAPPIRSYTTRISTDMYRKVQRDILKLVMLNRMRGYDIAEDLRLSNVFISDSFTVNLASHQGNCIQDASRFQGYAAAGVLFLDLCSALYPGTLAVSEDNDDLYKKLNWCLDDKRLIYHAALLSRFGRIGLSLKISMLTRFEFPRQGLKKKISLRDFYRSLPYTSDDWGQFPTDSMQGAYKRARLLSKHFTKDRRALHAHLIVNGAEPVLFWKALTGDWIVSLNRNKLMHPGSLLQWQSVDRLHWHMPMYLPKAQDYFHENKWWEHLEMKNYFPEA